MTEYEAAILALAKERGLLLTSETAGRTPELTSLVNSGFMSVVPHHDFGEHVLVFEITEAGRAILDTKPG